jgi:hypothetical protein
MTFRLRSDNLFWRESEGEVVALDAAVSRYVLANPTGAVLWKRLGDGATEAELVDTLCDRYGVSRDVAEVDVARFLDELSSRGLLDS